MCKEVQIYKQTTHKNFVFMLPKFYNYEKCQFFQNKIMNHEKLTSFYCDQIVHIKLL